MAFAIVNVTKQTGPFSIINTVVLTLIPPFLHAWTPTERGTIKTPSKLYDLII